jgi:hypothetical protein
MSMSFLSYLIPDVDIAKCAVRRRPIRYDENKGSYDTVVVVNIYHEYARNYSSGTSIYSQRIDKLLKSIRKESETLQGFVSDQRSC